MKHTTFRPVSKLLLMKIWLLSNMAKQFQWHTSISVKKVRRVHKTNYTAHRQHLQSYHCLKLSCVAAKIKSGELFKFKRRWDNKVRTFS